MYKFQFHLCFCYTFTVLWFIFQESFVYEWYQVTTLKLIYQIKTEESSIVDKRHRQWHQVGVFFHWQSFGSFQASMCFFSEELVPSLEAHGISEEMFCDSSDVLCDNKNVCVCVCVKRICWSFMALTFVFISFGTRISVFFETWSGNSCCQHFVFFFEFPCSHMFTVQEPESFRDANIFFPEGGSRRIIAFLF